MEHPKTIAQQETERPGILPSLRRLFTQLEPDVALVTGIALMSQAYDRPLSREQQALYLEVLSDLSPEELQRALSRALQEEKFWPPPARLRALAGHSTVEERTETLAQHTLEWLMTRIRLHGTAGHPGGGEYRTEESGEGFARVRVCVREPRPAPPLTPIMQQALDYLGGDLAGMQLIAQHPALHGWEDGSLWAAKEIEQRWREAYRRAYTQPKGGE